MKLLHLLTISLLYTHFFSNTTNYHYIKHLKDVTLSDIMSVGGKNASLGQMINGLNAQGIRVPHGFAVTFDGYNRYMKHNNLLENIHNLLAQITDTNDLKQLKSTSLIIKTLIENGTVPYDLKKEIYAAYEELSYYYGEKTCDVAVRSSATSEDLPDASFAGQQDTYLHVQGKEQLITYYKKCIASLFNERAIAYRKQQGFDDAHIALSVGVQKMVRSDLSCAGVAFSIDTETGFPDAIVINGSYGLGESIVQGSVTPDEFIVHKQTLSQGYKPIIKKQLGHKTTKIVYSHNPEELIHSIPVSHYDQNHFCLTDDDIVELARMVMSIEKHYAYLYMKKRISGLVPMDIEWAKDGIDGHIYIVQTRPETVHANNSYNTLMLYKLTQDHSTLKNSVILKGISVGQQITCGVARVINNIEDIHDISSHDIIVTDMTNPDWVPAMKKAAGIITNKGGRTCHAAIVSRELGIPAIVGTQNATDIISTGQEITLDCSTGTTGIVYAGNIPFTITEIPLDELPQPPVPVMVNIADPESAFKTSFLPTSGIGLVRLEFVINNTLKVHPMALLHPEKIDNQTTLKKIASITSAYNNNGPEFFIDQLACGVGMMAAAFYPRPIIVRFSDFKSNEYRNLIGGSYFEPIEENPMIGFRGASRYYHPHYQEAFALECEAIKKVRNVMGLTNVKVMIPFVRTLQEAESVINEMDKNGLVRGENGLEVIMMCELPCNVMLIKEFSNYFDGFSIGSNDLTQTTLGVDRDSELVSAIFDERDPAVKKMLTKAITKANRIGKYIGICGQAPSDFPDLAQFLIDIGINSLSFTPDTVIPFLMRYS